MHAPSLWQKRLAPLLFPFSLAYGLGMRLRRCAYAAGLLPRCEPGAPCVAVGNIAAGGGGKTPVAQWLLRWAVQEGLTPCLLSRGYGGTPPQNPLRVLPDTPWRHSGDEPLLLARAVPEALVLADPDRCRAVEYSRKLLPPQGPDIFVMDDGMQHLRLARHLNLVLLRPQDLQAEWGRVLPAGRWREPKSALASADAFLLKCPPDAFKALRPELLARLGHLGRPIFTMHLKPQGLRRIQDMAPLAQQAPQSYIFCSGVADNVQAAASAAALLGPPRAIQEFADHHAFHEKDVAALEVLRRHTGAEAIVCTAKDAVKLAGLATENFLFLEAAIEWGESLLVEGSFPHWWRARWQRLREDAP